MSRQEYVFTKTYVWDSKGPRVMWSRETQTVDRDPPTPLDPMVSIATRARNRQLPPEPNTPEHFYRNERFGHIRDTDPLGTITRRER